MRLCIPSLVSAISADEADTTVSRQSPEGNSPLDTPCGVSPKRGVGRPFPDAGH